MEKQEEMKLAINGGIGFGAKLNVKQLMTISKYMDENEELELTTFQQLYVEIPVDLHFGAIPAASLAAFATQRSDGLATDAGLDGYLHDCRSGKTDGQIGHQKNYDYRFYPPWKRVYPVLSNSYNRRELLDKCPVGIITGRTRECTCLFAGNNSICSGS